MWNYTDKVKEYFLNPKNVGELKDANTVGEVGSLACGDALKLFLKVEDGIIKDASFLTFGCASAIAASSALTEMIKGKTLDEALQVTNQDIAGYLGGLPKEKMHCSVMGQEALEAAIRNYRGEPALPHSHEGKLVCKCFGVTDLQIIKAIEGNALSTVEEITHYTKAGGACGNCVEEMGYILRDYQKGGVKKVEEIKPIQEKKPVKKLSNLQRMQEVVRVINEVIKPRLEQDGGDIDLVDIQENIVQVALRGTCSNCPSSRITIENFIQETLRDQVEESLIVEEVNA